MLASFFAVIYAEEHASAGPTQAPRSLHKAEPETNQEQPKLSIYINPAISWEEETINIFKPHVALDCNYAQRMGKQSNKMWILLSATSCNLHNTLTTEGKEGYTWCTRQVQISFTKPN